MPRAKNPSQGRKLQDVRRSYAPTVGFRDYILSKKPSVRRQAKTIIDSLADQFMELLGPGEDRYTENTFGLDAELDKGDVKVTIEREKRLRSESSGASIEAEADFDVGQYYLLGDPYLVFLLYRAIAKFANEAVDRLKEEKIASKVALALRPIEMDQRGFDPYATLRISPSATQETVKKQIRRLKRQYHPDAGGERKLFESIVRAEEAIGTQGARVRWDAERTLGKSSTFMDTNIMARWQSIGDVMSVAYSAQKAAFEMIDRGDDYKTLLETMKSSGKLTSPKRKPEEKKYSSLSYEENPKKKASPDTKNRAVAKTERLWERYCRSGKFDDLLKAYDALMEAKYQVTQYKHKQQITQGLNQARAELKRHAK